MTLLGVVVLALVAEVSAVSPTSQSALAIGDRLELLVDRHLIDRMDGVELRLNPPVDMGPVLAFDAPWDGRFSGYVTVLKDGPAYRMYYRGKPAPTQDGSDDETTCYAESTDGVHWRKPNLGLVEVNGSRENNVILDQKAGPIPHNFTPFLDTRPGVPADERFKALGGLFDMAGHRSSGGLVALVSADGIRWRRLQPTAVITTKNYPVQFTDATMSPAFWSEHERCYVAFIRTWKDDGTNTRVGWGGNIRWVGRVTSQDFVHWSKVEMMEFSNVPLEQLYNNNTSPYFRAPHIYLGLMGRIVFNRPVVTAAEVARIGMDARYSHDSSEPVLITSRGGTRYDRTFPEAWIRNGIGAEHWTSRSNYPVLNIVPTGPNEMSAYVQHSYGQPGCHLVRYKLETDRLASVNARFNGGEFVTKPLIFTGKNLLLNFSTSVVGGIRVEVQDAAGMALPGYALSDALEIVGNEIERAVGWKGGNDLGRLSGVPVRLRFVMKESDLYAFRFK
ncbi:MAG: hypothetical protein HY736_24610 [Verrucomicrobia bacterium]|nr:hypothetical protein [Verrucomicrobiota bacterium]